MIWNVVIAVILFLISVAGLLFVGNQLLDLFEKIFDNNK